MTTRILLTFPFIYEHLPDLEKYEPSPDFGFVTKDAPRHICSAYHSKFEENKGPLCFRSRDEMAGIKLFLIREKSKKELRLPLSSVRFIFAPGNVGYCVLYLHQFMNQLPNLHADADKALVFMLARLPKLSKDKSALRFSFLGNPMEFHKDLNGKYVDEPVRKQDCTVIFMPEQNMTRVTGFMDNYEGAQSVVKAMELNKENYENKIKPLFLVDFVSQLIAPFTGEKTDFLHSKSGHLYTLISHESHASPRFINALLQGHSRIQDSQGSSSLDPCFEFNISEQFHVYANERHWIVWGQDDGSKSLDTLFEIQFGQDLFMHYFLGLMQRYRRLKWLADYDAHPPKPAKFWPFQNVPVPLRDERKNIIKEDFKIYSHHPGRNVYARFSMRVHGSEHLLEEIEGKWKLYQDEENESRAKTAFIMGTGLLVIVVIAIVFGNAMELVGLVRE